MPAAAADAVDVSALFEQQPVGRRQIELVVLCAAVIFLDGFDAQALGYVAPVLIRSWDIGPGAFAPAFSASLFGMMIGALSLGPLADYWGRRRVIIWSTALFGLFTLSAAFATDLTGLISARFLTGIALGGAFPNAIALTAEWSPARRRSAMVMTMVCGISLGSAVGGYVAAALLPIWGWPSVFVVGGIVPLLLVPVLVVRLPESVRFMVLRGGDGVRLRVLLRETFPGAVVPDGARFVVEERRASGTTVGHLFRDGRTARTVLIWTMQFMNLYNLYFLTSWLPTVISGAGHSVQLAVVATALFQFAGIFGTLVFAQVAGRFHPCAALGVLYLLGGLFVVLTGMTAGWGAAEALPVLVAVGCAGFCIVGAQNASNAVAALLYPTFMRATGVGWAQGIGRIGSIIGPLVGGFILSLHWATQSVFLIAVVPTLVGAAAAFALSRVAPADAQGGDAASVPPAAAGR